MFSLKATIVNILFSLVGMVSLGFVIAKGFGDEDNFLVPFQFTFSFTLPGLLLTALTLVSLCCIGSPKVGVYKPFFPGKAFVLDKCSKEVKEVEDLKVVEEEESKKREVEQSKRGKVWTKEEMDEFTRKSSVTHFGQGIVHGRSGPHTVLNAGQVHYPSAAPVVYQVPVYQAPVMHATEFPESRSSVCYAISGH